MSDDKSTLYGQHSATTLIVIGTTCTAIGAAITFAMLDADSMPLGQRLFVSIGTGMWAAFCLYGWRVLFSEDESAD